MVYQCGLCFDDCFLCLFGYSNGAVCLREVVFRFSLPACALDWCLVGDGRCFWFICRVVGFFSPAFVGVGDHLFIGWLGIVMSCDYRGCLKLNAVEV